MKFITDKKDKDSSLFKKITKYDDRASLLLPKQDLKPIKKMIRKYKNKGFKNYVVIGIGGSNLGTKAIQEALKPEANMYYADTVDSDNISRIMKLKGKTLYIVISKSGGTTETIVNMNILAKKNVVIITDRNSKLYNEYIGTYDILLIPDKVGGRYSVFSAVGLFPLGLIGINIDKLLKGAQDMIDSCKKINIAKTSAEFIYKNYKKGRNIHNTFLFSNDLESVGKWYRQLMGESIGKEFNLKGKKVNVGITPMVSIGSTDLHSMAQLFFGGPNDKSHTIVMLEDAKKIKTSKVKLIEHVDNIELSTIMQSIVSGTINTFKKLKRPYQLIVMKKDEFDLGQFLQFKMIEMMELAKFLQVNAFDQPNVEKYKIETRKILGDING